MFSTVVVCEDPYTLAFDSTLWRVISVRNIKRDLRAAAQVSDCDISDWHINAMPESLPPEIKLCNCLKTFKSKLKTFLFPRAFNIWPVAKCFCILGLHGAI